MMIARHIIFDFLILDIRSDRSRFIDRHRSSVSLRPGIRNRPMIVRETIYAALWELGASAAQFTSTNRRLRHWADVAPAEQPALFMSEKGGQAAIKKLGAPIVWTLYAEFYLYAHSSDPYLAPAAILNPLLDALEAALAPSPTTGIQNLGLPQMVQHAYIAGKIQTDEGVLGDQAIAIVPVEILCL